MSSNQKGFPTVVFAFALVTLLSCCFSPVSSYFTLPRVSRTSDAIIIDCKFSFSSYYNSNRDFNFMSYVIIQMKVWVILLSPWAEATPLRVYLLILDTFHSQLSILTACFTVGGLILVGKQQQLPAARDRPHPHLQRSAKGSMALALPQSQLVKCGRSW